MSDIWTPAEVAPAVSETSKAQSGCSLSQAALTSSQLDGLCDRLGFTLVGTDSLSWPGTLPVRTLSRGGNSSRRRMLTRMLPPCQANSDSGSNPVTSMIVGLPVTAITLTDSDSPEPAEPACQTRGGL